MVFARRPACGLPRAFAASLLRAMPGKAKPQAAGKKPRKLSKASRQPRRRDADLCSTPCLLSATLSSKRATMLTALDHLHAAGRTACVLQA